MNKKLKLEYIPVTLNPKSILQTLCKDNFINADNVYRYYNIYLMFSGHQEFLINKKSLDYQVFKEIHGLR